MDNDKIVYHIINIEYVNKNKPIAGVIVRRWTEFESLIQECKDFLEEDEKVKVEE